MHDHPRPGSGAGATRYDQPMEVLRYDDPGTFRRDGASVLLADAARNNLPLGILQVLQDHPEVYPVFHLWLAVRHAKPVGLALQTEPYNVLRAEPIEDDAVAALAEAAVLDAGRLPGVTANLPWADRFAERVTTMTGRQAERIIGEGVWQLTAVADVPLPSGAARVATPGDRDTLRRWIQAFADEALPPEHRGTMLVRISRSTYVWRGRAAPTGCGMTKCRSRYRVIVTFPAWVRGSALSTRLHSIGAEAMPRGWSLSIRSPDSRPGIQRASCSPTWRTPRRTRSTPGSATRRSAMPSSTPSAPPFETDTLTQVMSHGESAARANDCLVLERVGESSRLRDTNNKVDGPRRATDADREGRPTGRSHMFETWTNDWQLRAACRGEDSSYFFAPSYFEKRREKDAREAVAKEICFRCPVLEVCREYALDVREGHGIWGGLNEMERRAMLRQRAAQAV